MSKRIPEGPESKSPIFKDSAPKNHAVNGFWDQSPFIFGTWTLWALSVTTIVIVVILTIRAMAIIIGLSLCKGMFTVILVFVAVSIVMITIRKPRARMQFPFG